MSPKRAAGVPLVGAALLIGCATTVHPPLRRACLDGDDRAWAVADPAALPIDAAILSQMADANPQFPASNDFNREAWFALPEENRVRLCRADWLREPSTYIAGAWWEFDVSGEEPVIVNRNSWLRVT